MRKQELTEPRLDITCRTQCRWMIRAAWMAPEIFSTFPEEVGEVALISSTGGVFEVRAGGELVWPRKTEGGFPDVKELKRRVRDRIAPDKEFRHVER